ncbi:MAG: hypothetical protein LQ351_002727 [Letrouitia transgressa]|nr:MAG: hypothetical protein LQ351_002727 [Letrouitia transgressa]
MSNIPSASPPNSIALRSPPTSSPSPFFTPPNPAWIYGEWFITHSSLPMWRTSRNVRITYSPLSNEKLDDLVQYQPLSSEKVKTVHGVDTPTGPGAYHWRGKGWLMIASSKWEILGWGELDNRGMEPRKQWVVTFFESTLFTPKGVDIYARSPEGLGDDVVREIKKEMERVGLGEGKGGVGEIFEVKRD